MSTAMIVAGVLVVAGIGIALITEAKVIGMLVGGVGTLFLVLSFYSDFSSQKNESVAKQDAREASFDAEWAKLDRVTSIDQKEALADRAHALNKEADEAKGERKKTESRNEQTRQPLLDAVTFKVNEAAAEAQGKKKGEIFVN